MLTLLRRFLVIAALMFWSGGFVFYAAIVVPIGTDVLGGATEQGFITRHVARKINWAGALALVPIAWDAFSTDPRRWRRDLRCTLIGFMLVCLIVLFRLHPQMDSLLHDEEGARWVESFDKFNQMHRMYLWTISVQWAASVGYLVVTLAAWRAQDRQVT